MVVVLLILAVFLLVVVVPRLVGSATGAAIDAGASAVTNRRHGSGRSKATFKTSLSPAAAISAARIASQRLGYVASGEQTGLALTATTPSGGMLTAEVHPQVGQTQVRIVAPRSGGASDDEQLRFRGAVLAELRASDPSACQG